jgi:hypothetical protein
MPIQFYGEETMLDQLHASGAQHLNTHLKRALGFHCCPFCASFSPWKIQKRELAAQHGREAEGHSSSFTVE